eukprot:13569748-Alexandrium_andersonii.AAC.1
MAQPTEMGLFFSSAPAVSLLFGKNKAFQWRNASGQVACSSMSHRSSAKRVSASLGRRASSSAPRPSRPLALWVPTAK